MPPILHDQCHQPYAECEHRVRCDPRDAIESRHCAALRARSAHTSARSRRARRRHCSATSACPRSIRCACRLTPGTLRDYIRAAPDYSRMCTSGDGRVFRSARRKSQSPWRRRPAREREGVAVRVSIAHLDARGLTHAISGSFPLHVPSRQLCAGRLFPVAGWAPAPPVFPTPQ